MNNQDVVLTLLLATLSIFFVWFRFDDLKFATFDRDHATQVGIRVQRLDLAMLVLLAVCVVVCLSTVGTVLTVSLLITPSATARLFCNKVNSITQLGVVIGVTEVLLGFIIAYHGDLPPGPTITVVTTTVFILAYVARFTTSERTYITHTHEHDHR